MKVFRIFAVLIPLTGLGADSLVDWDRARDLHQRSQHGAELTAEENGYLAEARRQRGANRTSSDRKSGARPSAAPEAEGLIPLTELTGDYRGRNGGLYGGGKNEPPARQQTLAASAVARIRPLDINGKSASDGGIVLLTIGMSNTTMESSAFKRLADADARKASSVLIVDGAQGGRDATEWAHAESEVWKVADDRIRASGGSPAQVQAVWIKQALKSPQAGFPAESDRLRDRLAEIVRIARQRYPNLQVAFLSSRIYAGYASSRLNPEPYAYESAFSVRDLIQQQMAGEPALNADPDRGAATAPVLLWGPYLWAAGSTPRKSDHLVYLPGDFGNDGTHPGDGARNKVAHQLLDFFTTDLNARGWFVKKP